jgi:hypothetical protein
MEKYKTSTRHGKNYHVVLESWRKIRYSESLQVSSCEYRLIKPDRTKMIILSKPGHYGFEWIVSTGIE